VLAGEKSVGEGVVDGDFVRGVREGGKSGGLSLGDQLFGRPDIVGGGFCEEISPVQGLSSFDGFEVAELGLPSYRLGVRVWSFMALPVAFVNSLQRVVRSGVHQALDRKERREPGAVASSVVVRMERAEEIHWSSWLGEEVSGGEGLASS